MENQITKEDLKIQALLERVSQLTAQYENQVADLRVELTFVTEERNQLKAESEENKETPKAK